MSTKIVILDFDGTLADTTGVILNAMQATIKELGLPARTDRECASMIGLRLVDIPSVLFPECDLDGEVYAQTYRRLFHIYDIEGAVVLYPNVIETLTELKNRGYVLTIASSRSRASLNNYINDLGISGANADYLCKYRKVTEFFEDVISFGASAKNTANLVVQTVFASFETEDDKYNFDLKISAKQLAELVKLLDEGKIKANLAHGTLQKMLETGNSVTEYIKPEDTVGLTEEQLVDLCKQAIEANPNAVNDIKNGKDKAINVMFGFIMKASRGKADVKKAEQIIREII